MLLTCLRLSFVSAASSLLGNWIIRGRTLLLFINLFLIRLLSWEQIICERALFFRKRGWINFGPVEFSFDLSLNYLSRLICRVVLFVRSFVHLYSLWYMKEDPRTVRFIGLISLFTGFILLLLIGERLRLLFVGWEGIGVASYGLIRFWGSRKAATQSALQAFIFNRVGDACLMLGIATLIRLGYSRRLFQLSII